MVVKLKVAPAGSKKVPEFTKTRERDEKESLRMRPRKLGKRPIVRPRKQGRGSKKKD